MGTDILIFAFLYALAWGVHKAAMCLVHGEGAWRRKVPHKLAVCFGFAGHPAFWDAVKDYAIHLVVYSGNVIKH